MGKFSSDAKLYAKKSLAVFSAAALLLSGGVTGAVATFTDSGIKVSAAETQTATQLKIYDENGNDLGDNPIIYIDNSQASGGITSRNLKIVASDEKGENVNDEIRCFVQNGGTDYIRVRFNGSVQTGTFSGLGALSTTIQGGYFDYSGTTPK